jgi:hypothetical protein
VVEPGLPDYLHTQNPNFGMYILWSVGVLWTFTMFDTYSGFFGHFWFWYIVPRKKTGKPV